MPWRERQDIDKTRNYVPAAKCKCQPWGTVYPTSARLLHRGALQHNGIMYKCNQTTPRNCAWYPHEHANIIKCTRAVLVHQFNIWIIWHDFGLTESQLNNLSKAWNKGLLNHFQKLLLTLLCQGIPDYNLSSAMLYGSKESISNMPTIRIPMRPAERLRHDNKKT